MDYDNKLFINIVAEMLAEVSRVAETEMRQASTLTTQDDLIAAARNMYEATKMLEVIEKETDEWNLYHPIRNLRLSIEEALRLCVDPLLLRDNGENPAWWTIPDGGYMKANENERFEIDDEGLKFIGHLGNVGVNVNQFHEFQDAAFQYVADCLPEDLRPVAWTFTRFTLDKERGVFIVSLKVKPR